MPHGKGVLQKLNGDLYNGEFKNGKPMGRGRLDFTNGDQMDGIFKDFILNGPGTKFFRSKLTIMKGTFVNGAIFGKGMATKYTNSDIKEIEFIIEGDFAANLPHGHCRIEYYNKTIVDDDFAGAADQAQEGYGSRQISQIYEGDVVEGRKHGRGVLFNRYAQAAHESIKQKNIKITESKYIGEFKED